MERIHIKPTENTPKVDFIPNGNLTLEGKSFCENPILFYAPLIQYCRNINVTEVIFDIDINYLNTASSKCLFELISELEENEQIIYAELRWHHDVESEELLEIGEIYADMCEKVKFEFVPVEVGVYV